MRYEMPILAVAGAVEVLALYNLIIRLADAGDTTALLAGAICVILVFAAVLHFAWTGADLLRLGAIAFVVSLVLGALTYRVFARIAGTGEPSDADRTRVLFWAASLGTFAYVAGPFLQIFQRTGRLDFPYKALFTHSWANFHIAGVGLLFLGAAWVVLGLWAALFAMIGIDVFKRLFIWGPFAASVSGAALAYGIAFAVKRADLILTLRGVTLGVMRLLLPPVALVALAFVVSAPFQGLGLLSATDHASTILLCWTVLMILLLNAVYQDGSDGAQFPRALVKVIEAAFVALPLFAAFVIYGLTLRIEQYGLTVVRTYGLIVAAIIAMYCFGYAYAVLRSRSAWLAALQPVNRSVALLVLAIILVLQIPWFDPSRLTADNQFRRVASGLVPVDGFDFGYLKFELGREGRATLDKMRGLTLHPQRDALQRALDEVDRYDNAFVWSQRNRNAHFNFTSAAPLPEGLTEAIQHHSITIECRDSPCFVFPILMAPGAPPSYGVLTSRVWDPITVYSPQQSDGAWQRTGQFTARQYSPDPIRPAIDAGDYAVVPPSMPDLRVGAHRFRFDENGAVSGP